MNIKELKNKYKIKRKEIEKRLEEFSRTTQEVYFNELVFCLLTPQSNAKKCWEAVEQINRLRSITPESVSKVLKTKTRFHNNKTAYILEAKKEWNNLKNTLENPRKLSTKELRNQLAESVKGYGLKEASHFLRNIGKSGNEIAILDRHILRNLKALNVIESEEIRNKKDYLKKEQKFLNFTKKAQIPADALDLLFWSNETNEIFK